MLVLAAYHKVSTILQLVLPVCKGYTGYTTLNIIEYYWMQFDSLSQTIFKNCGRRFSNIRAATGNCRRLGEPRSNLSPIRSFYLAIIPHKSHKETMVLQWDRLPRTGYPAFDLKRKMAYLWLITLATCRGCWLFWTCRQPIAESLSWCFWDIRCCPGLYWCIFLAHSKSDLTKTKCPSLSNSKEVTISPEPTWTYLKLLGKRSFKESSRGLYCLRIKWEVYMLPSWIKQILLPFL